MGRRGGAALLASSVLLLALTGCGGEGVGKGAGVTVYVAAPLCAEARGELARAHNRAGEVRVRAVCLPSPVGAGELNLAKVGANARRATEDSTTVGYIGELDPAAARFSRPIVESAGIAQISTLSGRAAMAKLLEAIRNADTSISLRESVHESLR